MHKFSSITHKLSSGMLKTLQSRLKFLLLYFNRLYHLILCFCAYFIADSYHVKFQPAFNRISSSGTDNILIHSAFFQLESDHILLQHCVLNFFEEVCNIKIFLYLFNSFVFDSSLQHVRICSF